MIHTVGGSNVSCKLFWKILAEYSLHSLLEGSQRLIEYKNCNQTDDEHLMKHGSLCLSLLTLFLSSKTNSWHRNLSTLKDVIHQTFKHNYIFFFRTVWLVSLPQRTMHVCAHCVFVCGRDYMCVNPSLTATAVIELIPLFSGHVIVSCVWLEPATYCVPPTPLQLKAWQQPLFLARPLLWSLPCFIKAWQFIPKPTVWAC